MSIVNELKQQTGSIDDLAKLPQVLIMQMAQKGQIREDMVAPILGRKAEMADAVARMQALQNAGQTPPTVMEQIMQANAMAEQPQMPQMPPQQMMPQMPQMAQQQMMPQQMLPEQMMAQQMPQGVENTGLAQLPIPERAYAGGGIVAFQDNPDQPVSSYMPVTYDDEGYRMPNPTVSGDSQAARDFNEFRDLQKLRREHAFKNIGEGIRSKIKSITDYFGASKPDEYKAKQAPTLIPPSSNVPKEEKISIGTRKPPPAASNTGANIPPQPDPIAETLKRLEAGISGDANERKAARREAANMRLIEAGLHIAGGESPYAFVNIGKGGAKGIQGYGEDIKGFRAEDSDRRKQLLGLGLKGIELQQANKLLNAQLPLLRSQAGYYDARARNPYGAAGLGGTVTPEVTKKIMDSYKMLKGNPKSDPAFFASLPLNTQQALETGAKTPSYKRGLETAARIADERMQQELDFIASRNRKSPTFSTTE